MRNLPVFNQGLVIIFYNTLFIRLM